MICVSLCPDRVIRIPPTVPGNLPSQLEIRWTDLRTHGLSASLHMVLLFIVHMCYFVALLQLLGALWLAY